MPTNIKDILLENEFLNNQNSNYRDYCQDIAEFCLPRKAWITTIRTKGERIKFNFLYDSTAIGAVRDTAAGFNTYLTNSSSRWFALESRDKDLNKIKEVRQFWKDTEDWAYAKLADSKFYNTTLEYYTDLLSFGTSTFSMLEEPKKFVSFKKIPVEEVNRVVDANGNLCGLYRNFKLTAYQAFKLWGDNVGKSIKESLEKKPFDEFEFVHFVGERYDRDVSKKDSGNMPYKSCWIAKKDEILMNESGYMEMPYISDVFYIDNNDTNGFSPAMDCFAEIRLVNAMQKTFIRADMKQADPPLVAPSRGFVLPLNFNPAGMNYRDPKTNKDDLQALPVGNGKLSTTYEHIKMVQEAIRERMFVNLFRSLNEVTKQMTVLETQQRLAQSMSILGPVVNRCNDALGKSIIRLINMGARNPMSGFPKPPDEIYSGKNQDYDIVYLSPMAKAQRQSEIMEIQSFLGDVNSIGAIIPSVFDKIDEDKTIDIMAQIRGITPEILRGDEQIKEIREQRQKQEQMMQTLQLAHTGAQIAKTGAEAEAVGSKK